MHTHININIDLFWGMKLTEIILKILIQVTHSGLETNFRG